MRVVVMVSKVARLSAIHTEIFYCTKCPLHSGRTRTVPGAGNPDAEIMFIGEAPGQQEDLQGLPFVGRSGQYLEELLEGIQLTRDDVFIANVIKCRPPENRDPQPLEIDTCNPYLREQIEIIDPLIIATLGRFSMNMFFPNARISQIHGQPKYGVNRVYFPLYHPAAVLRNPALRPEMSAAFEQLPLLLQEVKQRREAGISDEVAHTAESIPPDESEPSDLPRQKGLFD
jgi:DNA polymerase